MGYKLGYHILVLPNQVLLINSVLTNQVLLYIVPTYCTFALRWLVLQLLKGLQCMHITSFCVVLLIPIVI